MDSYRKHAMDELSALKAKLAEVEQRTIKQCSAALHAWVGDRDDKRTCIEVVEELADTIKEGGHG